MIETIGEWWIVIRDFLADETNKTAIEVLLSILAAAGVVYLYVTGRLAKLITFAAQIKSAVTFGDWLPYALWKLERHTGREIQLTPSQRRHPLLLGWPVLLRLLRERGLR